MIFTPRKIGRVAFLQVAILREFKSMILDFDYFKTANGQPQACVGMPEPLSVVELIKTFIDDKELSFSKSDKDKLQRMATYIETHIQVAYIAGKKQATKVWLEADDNKIEQLKQYEVGDFQSIAINLAPDDLSTAERNWYLEGFGWQWMEEWGQIVLKKNNQDNVDSPLSS